MLAKRRRISSFGEACRIRAALLVLVEIEDIGREEVKISIRRGFYLDRVFTSFLLW